MRRAKVGATKSNWLRSVSVEEVRHELFTLAVIATLPSLTLGTHAVGTLWFARSALAVDVVIRQPGRDGTECRAASLEGFLRVIFQLARDSQPRHSSIPSYRD